MPDRLAARRAYERKVRALAEHAEARRLEGWTSERIARELVDLRNKLKRDYRAGDDPALVALLEARNRAKYGDPLGPDADQLFGRYDDWDAVIAAAARPARLTEG